MDVRLRVDRIRCDGAGLCAELLPEAIALDDWGYPIVGPDVLDPALLGHARRAVDACPVLALRLEAAPSGSPVGRGASASRSDAGASACPSAGGSARR